MRLVFLLACGTMAFLVHAGPYLNDDITQAAALDSLSHGHYWVADLSPGFDPYLHSLFRNNALSVNGEHRQPVGSFLLDVLALPILAFLHGVAAVAGVRIAVALVPAALVAAAAHALASHLGYRPRTRNLVAAGTLLLFVPMGGPQPPLEPTLEFTSLVLVSLLCVATATAYLFDLVRTWWPSQQRNAPFVVATFLATPVFFWGLGVKYHAASVALLVVAMWCYRDGSRTPPGRTFLAFALCGLSFWSHLPSGSVQILVFLLLALGALRLGVVPLAQRAAAGIAGLAVGLLPDLLFRLLARQGATGSYYGPNSIEPSATGYVTGISGYAAGQGGSGGGLATSFFAQPGPSLQAIFEAFVWPDPIHVRYALPILAIAPLAILGLMALVRKASWDSARTPRPAILVPLVYLAVFLALVGARLTSIGEAPDMRYALTLWPCLALLWTPRLLQLSDTRGKRWVLARAAWVAAGCLLLTAAVDVGAHAAGHDLLPQGPYYDQTVVLRLAGLGLSGLLLATAWRARTSRSVGLAADAIVAASLGLAVAVELLMVLILHPPSEFVAWPVRGVAQALHWLLFKVAS